MPDTTERKLLPGDARPGTAVANDAMSLASAPLRQLAEMPRDELNHLAEEFGLDPTEYKTRQHLVAAIHDRRQLIAGLDREAMLDVVRWGRRPVTASATKEQIAQEIARIRLMKFSGLSQRGLLVLVRLRGLIAPDDAPVPALIRSLKKKEGLFSKLNRKRRAALGSLVANMIGEEGSASDYQFLPSDPAPRSEAPSAAPRAPRLRTISKSPACSVGSPTASRRPRIPI